MFFSKFTKYIKTQYTKKYVISSSQNKELVEHNSKMIPIISGLLILFGGINFIAIHITYINDLHSVKSLLIYYFGMFLFSLINFILNFVVKQHKNWNQHIRNIPIYLLFTSCLGIIIFISFNIENTFNTFAIYACLITISQLLVHIEPFFYGTMIFTAATIMAPHIYSLAGLSSVGDLYLYTIIVSLFSYNRWKTLKKTYESDKTIKDHVETIERELKLASNVQQSFYLHKKQDFTNWEIEYYNKPMTGVTGDLFDIYTYNKTLQGLCLFDVSGHGLSAGLVTMLVRNIIRKQFYDTPNQYLEQTMYNINSEFEKNRGNINSYMTGLLFRIVGDKIEFVNAAHPNPLIYRKNENKVTVYSDPNNMRGTALGLSALPPQFFSDFIEISSGDEIILFTDGITEAMNDNRIDFGYERFQTVIQNNIDKSLQDQISATVNALVDFTGNNQFEDDITIIILRHK